MSSLLCYQFKNTSFDHTPGASSLHSWSIFPAHTPGASYLNNLFLRPSYPFSQMGDKKPLARLATQQVLFMTGKGTKKDTAIYKRIATNGYTDKDLVWEMAEFLKVRGKLDDELDKSARALNDRIARHNFRYDNIPTDEFVQMYESDGFKKYTDRYPHPGVEQQLQRIYAIKKVTPNAGYSQYQGDPGNSGVYNTPFQPQALLPVTETLSIEGGPSTGTARVHEVPTSPVSLPDSTSSPQIERRKSENDAGQPPAKRRQTKCGNCNKEGHKKNRCEDPCSKCNQKHPGKPCPPSEMNQASASTDAE
ncbi:hypothetical protein BC832DRAFT_594827 [Gaertneriomyces semiglobifer]|nr:hypothetical protein BC832DRAFT_594827 [Gaertneriomyces semiglobifer]